MKNVSFGRQDPFQHKCRGCGTDPSIDCAQRSEMSSHEQWSTEITTLNTHARKIKTPLALRPSDHEMSQAYTSDILGRPHKHKWIPTT